MVRPHAEPEGRAGWEVQMPGSRPAACAPTLGRDGLPSCADVAKRTPGRVAFRMGRCDIGYGEGSCDARGALCSWSHGSQAAGTRLGCARPRHIATAHRPAHGRIARGRSRRCWPCRHMSRGDLASRRTLMSSFVYALVHHLSCSAPSASATDMCEAAYPPLVCPVRAQTSLHPHP